MKLDLQHLNLANAIKVARATLAELPPDNVEKVDANLAVDSGEHFEYQQLQSTAHAAGVLPTDDAQLVYFALGEVGSEKNGGWAAGTDTATKYVVTRVIEEILTQRLAERGVNV